MTASEWETALVRAELTPERFQAPLYALAEEAPSEHPADYTVTVAGPERHDGEAPFTYVVSEYTRETAWAQALAWHLLHEDCLDAYVVAAESHIGPPPADCDYQWTDLRLDAMRARLLQLLGHTPATADPEGSAGGPAARDSR